ncbi:MULTISPECIES: hypothetical protein [Salimicrobium]|uniref:YneQ n=1 Tax=Salimicrobium humidisoli TaxID=2029857 RepID=A0ABX4HNU1_9BACI|nr:MULTISPECIES: hypothetical protein [Salimicrobium]PBB04859.1 hypothetical protein CKW00_11985 [Salimicrobium humidisoli]
MAFGIGKEELRKWKRDVRAGNIAILTHYWLDDRFPGCDTVTKVGCSDIEKLAEWGGQYGLKKEWIDRKEGFPHYDLFGRHQFTILKAENRNDHIERFRLHQKSSRYL